MAEINHASAKLTDEYMTLAGVDRVVDMDRGSLAVDHLVVPRLVLHGANQAKTVEVRDGDKVNYEWSVIDYLDAAQKIVASRLIAKLLGQNRTEPAYLFSAREGLTIWTSVGTGNVITVSPEGEEQSQSLARDGEPAFVNPGTFYAIEAMSEQPTAQFVISHFHKPAVQKPEQIQSRVYKAPDFIEEAGQQIAVPEVLALYFPELSTN